ncbi:MAG: hypothetical protein R3B58_03405 [Phycisphaerales bacterium]
MHMNSCRVTIGAGLTIVAIASVASGQCIGEWSAWQNVAYPGADGRVEDYVMWDPDGAGPLGEQLVLAGSFLTIGDTVCENMGRYDGQTWTGIPALAVHTKASWTSILCVGVFEGDLIAGGRFTQIDGVDANNIARFDGQAWHQMGDGIGSSQNDLVRTVMVHNGQLLAGGEFNDPQPPFSAPANVASWNGSEWVPYGHGTGGDIYTMAEYEGDVVVGGMFPSAVAQWTGTQWEPIGGGVPANNYGAFSLLVDGTDLYVGIGQFDSGSSPSEAVWRWDGQAWHSLGPGMFTSFIRVDSLTMHNGELIAGGYFAVGSWPPAAGVHTARWDGSAWQPLSVLPDWWAIGLAETVNAFVEVGDSVVVAGQFNEIGDRYKMNNLATWDGTMWGEIGDGPNDTVRSVEVFQGDVYVGGDFTRLDSNGPHLGVARWDGSAWEEFGALAGNHGGVMDITTYNDELYVAGYFSDVGGMTAQNIARWDGKTWSSVGTGIDPRVRVLDSIDGKLLVGGEFTNAGGQPVEYLATWDGAQWAAIAPGLNDDVWALAVDGSTCYAGGRFDTAGGTATPSGIAHWDGSTWHAVGPSTPVYPNSLAIYQGDLYVAGGNSATSPVLMKWDGMQWHTLVEGLGTVSMLQVQHDRLLVGGLVHDAGLPVLRGLAEWDGSALTTVGSGLSNAALDVAPLSRGRLVAVGDFSQAGGVVAPRIAVFGCTCYADCNESGSLDIFDYICFGNAYANNDPYADCDGNTTFNIFEYICFGNAYAAGCP